MAFVESNGVRIYYDVIERTAPWVTKPETIIFNHGIGIDHRMWVKWIPALIDRYQIILLDMRGFGQSTIPPADAKWSMDMLVDDVLSVASAVGAARFHLAGESMGGTVALCTYFRNPKVLRSITVSNGAHIGASLENLNDWRDVISSGGMNGWSKMMSGRRFYDDGLQPDERAWFDEAQRSSSPELVPECACGSARHRSHPEAEGNRRAGFNSARRREPLYSADDYQRTSCRTAG